MFIPMLTWRIQGSFSIPCSNLDPQIYMWCQGLQGQQRTYRKAISIWGACDGSPQIASQRVRLGASVPLTDAFSQSYQPSGAIREARSVPPLPSSYRYCVNKKHKELGSLLTPMMTQSRNSTILFAVCLDTACPQGQPPPGPARILIL